MVIAGAVLLLASGCASHVPLHAQARSRYPVERAQAAVSLGARDDLEGVPALVGLLEDHDRAVRMYAIRSLTRLTGETYGYRFFSPDGERAAAVRRWREALRDGTLTARATTSGPIGAEVGSAGPLAGEAP